jgi:hypothetical protein
VKAAPGLPTIPSMCELAPAAAAFAEDEAAAEQVKTPRLGLPKSRLGLSSAAPLAVRSEHGNSSSSPALAAAWGWWWPLGSKAGAPADDAAAVALAPASVVAVPAGNDATYTATATASRGWWPTWGTVSGPEHTTQQWLAAAEAAAEPQAASAAADEASSGAGATSSTWQLASRVVGVAAAPFVWYWHAVGSTLSAGVDMASWLVEMAVWWALLPGRVAVWALLLPFRVEAAAVRWLLPGWRAPAEQQARQL